MLKKAVRPFIDEMPQGSTNHELEAVIERIKQEAPEKFHTAESLNSRLYVSDFTNNENVKWHPSTK